MQNDFHRSRRGIEKFDDFLLVQRTSAACGCRVGDFSVKELRDG
jgi:hypothetical protein